MLQDPQKKLHQLENKLNEWISTGVQAPFMAEGSTSVSSKGKRRKKQTSVWLKKQTENYYCFSFLLDTKLLYFIILNNTKKDMIFLCSLKRGRSKESSINSHVYINSKPNDKQN